MIGNIVSPYLIVTGLALLCVIGFFYWDHSDINQHAIKIAEISVFDDNDRRFGQLINRRLMEKPLGLKYQTHEEAEYLKLHKCKDHGEVYSASYLISKKHIMEHYIDYNLSTCNTEMASWMIMDTTMDPANDKAGTLIQSLDALDFSVIHLSAFERLQRRHSRTSKDSLQTVVVMPWLGSEVGAGNSHVNNRLEYLKACFYSFYIEFPHVVVVVKSKKDEFIARNHSGLPFFDVILLDDLPTSSSLPVATLQITKNRIKEGIWNFSYVFFTESDQ
eukprot:gene5181-10360_t